MYRRQNQAERILHGLYVSTIGLVCLLSRNHADNVRRIPFNHRLRPGQLLGDDGRVYTQLHTERMRSRRVPCRCVAPRQNTQCGLQEPGESKYTVHFVFEIGLEWLRAGVRHRLFHPDLQDALSGVRLHSNG